MGSGGVFFLPCCFSPFRHIIPIPGIYLEGGERGGGIRLVIFSPFIIISVLGLLWRRGEGKIIGPQAFFTDKRICICGVSDLEKHVCHVYIWMDVYTEVGREDLTQETMACTCIRMLPVDEPVSHRRVRWLSWTSLYVEGNGRIPLDGHVWTN